MQFNDQTANLVTTLKLTPGQRKSMTAYWKQWKRGRLKLDTLLDTSRAHLAHLPAHLDVPSTFIALVDAYCAPQRNAARGPHSTAQRMVMPQRLDTMTVPAPRVSPAGASPKEKVEGGISATRLLGNSPGDIARANAAVETLRCMHARDRDMFVENLDSHMPGVFMNPKQVCFSWYLPTSYCPNKCMLVWRMIVALVLCGTPYPLVMFLPVCLTYRKVLFSFVF
jgi:hypothetical protein